MPLQCHVFDAAQRLALLRLQVGTRFDEVSAHSLSEPRRRPGGTQRVLHHGAAAGTDLDERHFIRRPHRLPHVCRPQPDQFAEHLADLRRGDEIAGRAERGAAIVVAVLRIVEAHGHEFGDRNRPRLRDAGADFRLQWRGLLRRHG